MTNSTYGTLLGAVVGGVVGGIIVPYGGIPLGAAIGATLGGLGANLYDTLTAPDTLRRQDSVADQSLQTSTYGTAVPQVWGAYVVSGNVIWAGQKIPHQTRDATSGKGGGAQNVTITTTYTQSFALCLCDTRLTGPMDFIVKIWRNNTVIYDRSQSGPTLPDGWTFYPGTSTQGIDPTMAADQGPGLTPAYRYRAYAVVVDDKLGTTGQTNIYRVEVARAGDNVVAPFLSAMCLGAGLTAGEIDVTAVDTGIPLSILLTNVQQARAAIDDVLDAYRLYAVESSRKLAFRRRGTGSVVASIPEAHTGAATNEHTQQGVAIERLDTAGLPTELEVTYPDKDLLYQNNVQRFHMARAADLPVNPRSLGTAIALQPAQAQQWATETLTTAWIQREMLRTTLPRIYAPLEPGDRVTLTVRVIVYSLVLTETSYDGAGIVEIQATIDATSVTDAVPTYPDTPPPTVPPLPLVEGTDGYFLNLPALSAADTVPRFHVGFLPVGTPWEGATLHRSVDGEATYQQVAYNTVPVLTGIVATAIGAGTTHAYDDVTSITVVMDGGGALTSVDDAALEAGINLFLLGAEVLSAGIASLVGTDTYRLTHLLRGRRGTEHAQATHGAGERLTLLDQGAKAVPMALTDAGVARDFKVVTLGQPIADVTSESFTPTAANMFPFTAWYIAAQQLSDGGWQILWQYRPRFGGDWVDGFTTGFDGDHDGFTVTIYTNGTYTSLARIILTSGGTTVDATSGKGVLYTALEQNADFGSLQATIYYTVAQRTSAGDGPAVQQVAP